MFNNNIIKPLLLLRSNLVGLKIYLISLANHIVFFLIRTSIINFGKIIIALTKVNTKKLL